MTRVTVTDALEREVAIYQAIMEKAERYEYWICASTRTCSSAGIWNIDKNL
jgi:hypothetical protein